MKKIKEAKGITLVALVITIIVMLILSAVTINLTLGERGIFNVAQQAAKNYTDAAEKEETDLNNFRNEINNTLNGLSSGVVTKPEEPKQEWGDITATNYGDYVNYPVANGSTEKGHKTDWRIFYKDNDGYVYLISSYYLPYTQVPSGLANYSGYGEYSSYWPTTPNSYTNVPQSTYDRYMMNFKYNGSPNNNQVNMRCVSHLMNTSVWSKFVNTTYAIDAIGAPTLEMWVESWNAKGNKKLYYDNTNSNGYYVGTSSTPTTEIVSISNTNTLYFPVTSNTSSNENGYHYWLSSPSANYTTGLMCIDVNGYVGGTRCTNGSLSVRPIVRLKNTISAEQGADGVWNLK